MFAKIFAVFAAFGAAQRAAAALDAHRAPNPRDLARLGIDAGALGAVNRV